MTGILSKIIGRTLRRAQEDPDKQGPVRLPQKFSKLNPREKKHIEEMVILGVLLSCVAHSDEEISREEEKEIKKILVEKGRVSPEDSLVVIAAARESQDHRPDIQGFTREIAKKPYPERLEVLELLFCVGFADSRLSHIETETIRKISGLLWISHKDFIHTKLKIKNRLATSR